MPVVWTQRRVRGINLGALPAHEVPLKLLHRLQSLPLARKRLHVAAWQQQDRAEGVREWEELKSCQVSKTEERISKKKSWKKNPEGEPVREPIRFLHCQLVWLVATQRLLLVLGVMLGMHHRPVVPCPDAPLHLRYIMQNIPLKYAFMMQNSLW